MPSSLISPSSLNCFPAHQPVATNSMHFQFSYTPHLQHLQSEAHLESSGTSAVEFFCVFRPLAISAKELHHGCLTGF